MVGVYFNDFSQESTKTDSIYKYKPIFIQPTYYIKTREGVYEGFENFSFDELNYEITEKDIHFLENSKLDISQHNFEIVIDIFEKIIVVD